MFKNLFQKRKTGNYTSTDFAIDILKNLNCSIEKDKDGDRVYFTYQGENFVLLPINKQVIQIYCHEGNIELNDPGIPVLIKVLNDINYRYNLLSSFYIEDKENNKLLVINKVTTAFIPEMSDSTEYLETILSLFFEAGRDIRSMFKECVSEQKRNTVFKVQGFSSNNQD